MKEDIKVSIICMTYNHGEYIGDALEGFVSQKTDFRFEVLVHDDASTDNTAEIIRGYAERYPDIIRPICQTENQYSRNVDIPRSILLPLARGKYLALCEGDDRWVDPQKLQKQFDFMEAHPEYAICTHRAVFADHENGSCRTLPKQAAGRSYSTDEVIILGGLFFATASFFMRRDTYAAMPECFRAGRFDDWQLVIYGSIGGGCYCLQDVMAVYNNKRKGSYTERNWKDRELRDRINQDALHMLEQVNAYYNYQYDHAIQNRIRHYQYRLYKYQGRLDEIQGDEYAEFRVLDQAGEKLREIRARARPDPS